MEVGIRVMPGVYLYFTTSIRFWLLRLFKEDTACMYKLGI